MLPSLCHAFLAQWNYRSPSFTHSTCYITTNQTIPWHLFKTPNDYGWNLDTYFSSNLKPNHVGIKYGNEKLISGRIRIQIQIVEFRYEIEFELCKCNIPPYPIFPIFYWVSIFYRIFYLEFLEKKIAKFLNIHYFIIYSTTYYL